MLRLNSSMVWDSSKGNKVAQATFDQVTKSGKVKTLKAEQFDYRDGLLELNGESYQIDIPVDINANPEELLAWFKKVTSKGQIDMIDLLVPPKPRDTSFGETAVDVATLKWEYPECEWRAVDKYGTIPYFKNRPTLDGAGYWISYVADDYANYSGHFALDTENYKRSLQRKD